jgi:four helix bundle protein
MADGFRDLIVRQRAIQLTVALYKLTRMFPREEIYGLTSQLRRAGVSIASNIAEGWGRQTDGEYKHFLGMARGSNLEVQTQLVIARELGFGDQQVLNQCDSLSNEVARMLVALIKSIDAPKLKSEST